MKQNQTASNKEALKKKTWYKPIVLTIKQKELAEYIKAAARSGWCGSNGR